MTPAVFAFAGGWYYPQGGVRDLVASFSTMAEALAFVEGNRELREPHDPERLATWAHVWHPASGAIVRWERDVGNTYRPAANEPLAAWDMVPS